MRVNNQDTAAAQAYRTRDATVWGKRDSTCALTANDTENAWEHYDNSNMETERELIVSKETLQLIKEMRNQAQADDIVDPTTFKNVKYLENTRKQF